MSGKSKNEISKDLEVVLGKLVRQATDSLVGHIVLIELLEEKGIISKEEYKSKIEVRNNDIREQIIKYLEAGY